MAAVPVPLSLLVPARVEDDDDDADDDDGVTVEWARGLCPTVSRSIAGHRALTRYASTSSEVTTAPADGDAEPPPPPPLLRLRCPAVDELL
eukprot:COSAG01_NODE_8964_length_2601_cov_1.430855_4_plen_91_part_00